MSISEEGTVLDIPAVRSPSSGVLEVLSRALGFAEEIAASSSSQASGSAAVSSAHASTIANILSPHTGDGSTSLNPRTGGSSTRLNPLTRDDVHLLLTSRGVDYQAVIHTADRVRTLVAGDKVWGKAERKFDVHASSFMVIQVH